MEPRDGGRMGLPWPDVPTNADTPGEKVAEVLVVSIQQSNP